MAQRAYANAGQRFAALQTLVNAVGNAPDAKAIADLQARIAAALASGEIYMIYQPKVLVQTNEIVGVEAALYPSVYRSLRRLSADPSHPS